jgi:hypothetical protein
VSSAARFCCTHSALSLFWIFTRCYRVPCCSKCFLIAWLNLNFSNSNSNRRFLHVHAHRWYNFMNRDYLQSYCSILSKRFFKLAKLLFSVWQLGHVFITIYIRIWIQNVVLFWFSTFEILERTFCTPTKAVYYATKVHPLILKTSEYQHQLWVYRCQLVVSGTYLSHSSLRNSLYWSRMTPFSTGSIDDNSRKVSKDLDLLCALACLIPWAKFIVFNSDDQSDRESRWSIE